MCRYAIPFLAAENQIADRQLDVADTHFGFADTQSRSPLPGASLLVYNSGLRIGHPAGVTCFPSASCVRSASLHAIQLSRLCSACGVGRIAVALCNQRLPRCTKIRSTAVLLLDEWVHSTPGRSANVKFCLRPFLTSAAPVQEASNAFRKSSRDMRAWVRIVRSVEPLILRCDGMVSGVWVPSAFSRSIEM